MIIVGNLRRTPREWGPISGINRDIKPVSLPRSTATFSECYLRIPNRIGNRTENLNPQVKQSFIVCSVSHGREMHLGCVSVMWSDCLFVTSAILELLQVCCQLLIFFFIIIIYQH